MSFHLNLSAETTRIWALNAGNATRYGDFAGDTNIGNWYTASAATNLETLVNPAPAAVYQSGKWTGFSSAPFSYTIDALKPSGRYTLRLHHNVSDSNHKFSVTVNDVLVETAYDKYVASGGRLKFALIPEYPFQATSEGRCVVTLGTVQANYYATINGIEVVEAATNNLICPHAVYWPQPIRGSVPAAYKTGVWLSWPDQVYGNLLTNVFTVFRSTNEVDSFMPVAVVSNATWFTDADTLRGLTNRYFVKRGVFAGAYAGAPQTNEYASLMIPVNADYYAIPYRCIWAVNCGSALGYGQFAPDAQFSGASSLCSPTETAPLSVPGTLGFPAPTNVYQTVRYTLANTSIIYTFPVMTNRFYRFRLHFREGWSTTTRRFSIAVNGTSVTNDYSISDAAGGVNTATVFECDGLSDTNGQIHVALTKGTVDAPSVCGIEVVEPYDAPPMSGEIPVTVSNAWEAVAEVRPRFGNTSASSGTVWRAEAPDGAYVSLGVALFSGGIWGDTPETGLQTNKSYRYVVRADSVTPGTNVQGTALTRFVPNRYSVWMGSSSLLHFVPPTDFIQGAYNLYAVTKAIDRSLVSGAAPLAVYQQQWWNTQLNFLFTNLHAGATYRLRLHDAETANVYTRGFSIVVNGQTVCDRYVPAMVAGKLDRAAAPVFSVQADASGRLAVQLNKVTENPLVGGFEVRATPVTAAPGGLGFAPGSAKVALSWQPVVGADGYAVYRTAAGGEPQEVGRVTGTSFTDATGSVGTYYSYIIRAFNEMGDGPAATSEAVRYPAMKGSLIRIF